MAATPARPQAQLAPKPEIVWKKLPEDFVLPDDPVDHLNQPAIAAALTDSLFLAGYLSGTAETTTNYGICAQVDGKPVVKAPDWAWIPAIATSKLEIERSYTPVLEGELPFVVMEFLSEKGISEYSVKPSYPPGTWFYYERILKIPNYVIFHPKNGVIEFYKISEEGLYELQMPHQDLYWLAEADLFLGAWKGTHQDRFGWWLRWWNVDRQMLLWGEELIAQEREKAEQEGARAEQAEQALKRTRRSLQNVIARLMELGLNVEQIADTLSLSVSDIQQHLQNQPDP